MHNITFNLSQMHNFGSSFYDFLRLRKSFFVDNLGWNIPHDDDVEMDQYDNPQAWYSLVLKQGKVIGGARAMSTTAQWGSHTYMLRDAVKGKLIDIPAHVLGRDIQEENMWECTRLVMSDDVCRCRSRKWGKSADVVIAIGFDESSAPAWFWGRTDR